MRAWIDELLREAGVIELRHPSDDGHRWVSGLFDDAVALRKVVAGLDGTCNLFTTLNRPNAEIRATNAMGSRALKDADIVGYTRLSCEPQDVAQRCLLRRVRARLPAVHRRERDT